MPNRPGAKLWTEWRAVAARGISCGWVKDDPVSAVTWAIGLDDHPLVKASAFLGVGGVSVQNVESLPLGIGNEK
jgi:hypothetical protein